jgi:hypothetical protein
MKGISNLTFLLFFTLSYCNIILSQPLQFAKEKIEVKIYNGYAVVTGDYTFTNKNKNKLRSTLFYPFPVNQSYFYPDTISVYAENNESISFTKSSTGVYFGIKVPADSETTVKVRYSQRISLDTMKYILTSTQSWIHPLEKAEYIISLPKEFDLKDISIKPYKKDSGSTDNIYTINKENFMPETDLIIAWARREK